MKRKLAVTVVLIVMMMVNLAGSAYAQAVASVAGLSPANSFWNSAKNLIMPVLYKAGSKGGWAAGSFTPASLAVLAGGIFYTVYKEDSASFPALKHWVESLSVSVAGGEYKVATEVIVPAAGGWLEQCMAAWTVQAVNAGYDLNLGLFPSGAAEDAAWHAMGFYLAGDAGGTCHGTQQVTGQDCAAWDGEATVSIGGHAMWNIYSGVPANGTCQYLGLSKIIAAHTGGSIPPSQYSTEIFQQTIVIPTLAGKLGTALVAGNASARAAAKDIMAWFNKQLVGNKTDIDKAGSATKTLRELLEEAAGAATGSAIKNALAADANDTTQGEDMSEDLISAADKIALAEKEAELSDEETPPDEDPGEPEDPIVMPDLPGPSETENEDVIDDTGNDQDIETEQGKVSTILAPLKAIYETLQGSIMTSINNIIPQGSGGVCSLQASVFNGVFNADFCSVDFSALRTLVIAVSALLGLLILLS